MAGSQSIQITLSFSRQLELFCSVRLEIQGKQVEKKFETPGIISFEKKGILSASVKDRSC